MDFPVSKYSYCEHDTLSEMEAPPIEYAPVYSWVWRGEITEGGIIEGLENMKKRGIRGLYILPSPSQFSQANSNCAGEKEYLSREFMEQVKFAVTEAEKRGMCCWMYDEGGWPSGSANGRVVLENPELEAYGVDVHGNAKVIPPAAQPYPDLLNKKSTERFVEYTHEVYKETFDGNYGAHFPITFTDEPHVYTLGDTTLTAWTDDFETLFSERFGYDITEHMEALFGEEIRTENDRKVRADYKDLLSSLFAENYFMVLRDWCRKNGSLSGGHVGGDDVAFGNAKWGYHHILRCLRAMDVPGIDIIWRQAFPGPEMKGVEPYAPLCANRFFPRYASSAAHQTGARLALTESFAIYGCGITYDQMRWVYNFQVVRGLNVLNPMNMRFRYTGDQVARVGQPTFSPLLPGAEDLRLFNEWATRVSYTMSAGKPLAEAALFMPMRDIWAGDAVARAAAERFEAVGSELESCGCDIDVVDEDAILAAEIKNGALCVGDAAYRTIYLQDDTVTLLENVKQKLAEFGQAGGTVCVCRGEYDVDPIVKSDSHIRATRRKTAEGTVYYVTNEAFGAAKGVITFPKETAKTAVKIDMKTGKREVVSVVPFVYDFSLGGEAVLLFADVPALSTSAQYSVREKAVELSDFSFRRLRQVRISQTEGFAEEVFDEPYRPITIGDWQAVLGESFSGDVEYRTVFSANEEMQAGAVLDLGKVCYSCEIVLNGEPIATQIFSPFCVELPALKEENELRIRVSNTLANEYVYHDFAQWIPNYEPGYMEVLQKTFNQESLCSGLLGPVTIRY